MYSWYNMACFFFKVWWTLSFRISCTTVSRKGNWGQNHNVSDSIMVSGRRYRTFIVYMCRWIQWEQPISHVKGAFWQSRHMTMKVNRRCPVLLNIQVLVREDDLLPGVGWGILESVLVSFSCELEILGKRDSQLRNYFHLNCLWVCLGVGFSWLIIGTGSKAHCGQYYS